MLEQGVVRPVWRILLRVKWAPLKRDNLQRSILCQRCLPLVKGKLRDVVKTGGNQPTYISMTHRRNLPGRALFQYEYRYT